MKKFLRKLLPTIVMLAVSATLVGTSTFAWFSMNNKVTVTGMVIKTKVSSNLLIADDTLDSTEVKPENAFTSSLTKAVKGFLEPVSTANAIDFFYTNDAKADGSKISSEAFIQYSSATISDATYTDDFSKYYGVTKSDAGAEYGYRAVPYVDYIFQLKAQNTKPDGESNKQYIVVDKLLLKYMGGEPAGKAHRVAFFVKEITREAAFSSGVQGSSSTYKVQSSSNFDNNGRAPGTSSATSEAVVNGVTSYTDAIYVSESTALAEVPANSTKFYKVIVRMWLEGQDTSCNTQTYMALTSDWQFDLSLALVDAPEGTTYINQTNSSGTL